MNPISKMSQLQTGHSLEAELCGIPFARNLYPMWVFDRETLAFLEVNAAATAKYGYTREQFLGMTVTDLRPPDDVREFLRTAHSKEGVTAESWRHCTRTGAIVPVSITSWELTFRGRPAKLVLARWESLPAASSSIPGVDLPRPVKANKALDAYEHK